MDIGMRETPHRGNTLQSRGKIHRHKFPVPVLRVASDPLNDFGRPPALFFNQRHHARDNRGGRRSFKQTFERAAAVGNRGQRPIQFMRNEA